MRFAKAGQIFSVSLSLCLSRASACLNELNTVSGDVCRNKKFVSKVSKQQNTKKGENARGERSTVAMTKVVAILSQDS